MITETIGREVSQVNPRELADSVVVQLPYYEKTYNVLLDDEDINRILIRGVENLTRNHKLDGFDFYFIPKPKIPSLDTRFIVGALAISMFGEDEHDHPQDLNMDIGFVSHSEAIRHRGILSVHKSYLRSNWEKIGYREMEPLGEGLEYEEDYIRPEPTPPRIKDRLVNFLFREEMPLHQGKIHFSFPSARAYK